MDPEIDCGAPGQLGFDGEHLIPNLMHSLPRQLYRRLILLPPKSPLISINSNAKAPITIFHGLLLDMQYKKVQRPI